MLYTIAVVLIVLWLLGMVSSYTLSGFVHVLLVVAIILILVRLIEGRRTRQLDLPHARASRCFGRDLGQLHHG